MKKTILALLLVLAWVSSGWATTIGTYAFYDTWANEDPSLAGEGFVTMEISESADGKALMAVIDNKSKTTLNGNPAPNISVITGFSFEFDDSSILKQSYTWSLSAEDDVPSVQNITSQWEIPKTANGFSGEFLYNTIGIDPAYNLDPISLVTPFSGDIKFTAINGPENGLYNPDLDPLTLANAGIGNINFFTTATFEITFTNVSDLKLKNVFVRMQRVGLEEVGSLKLTGLFTAWDEGGGGGGIVVVPEPATLVLLGVGLVGLVLMQRKRVGRN